MSDTPDPFDGEPSDEDPFAGIPFLGGFMQMLGGGAGVGWDAARQLAVALATGGSSEPNVDPSERIALEQLARVAELHLTQATGRPLRRPVEVRAVTRSQWATESLDVYRPLFETLSGTLADAGGAEAADDPMMGPLMAAMRPMMLSFTAGGLVGHLARRSLGSYDLPIPRTGRDDVLLVVPNLDEFRSDWSLPADELELWLCLHELAHHDVLTLPHVAERISGLLLAYAGAFETDPSTLDQRLGGLDLTGSPDDLARLQQVLGDPDVVLGAVESDRQRAIAADLAAVVAAVVGYVDHIMDTVGGRLMGSYGQLTEALRRRRVEADRSDRFVERLLGLELTQDAYDRARAFVDGVVERAGTDGLDRLWSDERHLPTPNEVDAPGLWLARIDLDHQPDDPPDEDTGDPDDG